MMVGKREIVEFSRVLEKRAKEMGRKLIINK